MSRATKILSVVLAFALIGVGVRQFRASTQAQQPSIPRPIAGEDTVFLEELTWMEVRDAIAEGRSSIIVPTGGIEQNGPYVALGKHNYILELTTESIARALGNTLVAPIVKFVPEGSIDPPDGHMLYPGTISLRDRTFELLLTDICESLLAHGFKKIYLLGDSGGNQEGMERVAVSLVERGVHFIPEYYDYEFLNKWLTEQRYHQVSEGVHDDLAFTSQVLVKDPKFVRAEQRRKAGKFTINGIALDPIEKTRELGKQLIKLRTEQTVIAIKRRTTPE